VRPPTQEERAIELLRQFPVIVRALAQIADMDYRGNRSQESEIAHRALVAAGLRSSTTTNNRKESL
jgi:hypothetical protein